METIDGEIVSEHPSTALATRPTYDAPVVWATSGFSLAVDEAIERKKQKDRLLREVLVKETHYGVIPGTGTKPTLLKPGAEMLLSLLRLNVQFLDKETPVIDLDGRDHNGEPYIRYYVTCRIYKQTGPKVDDRMIVAESDGVCSSWEPKYRYRNAKRLCPKCGKATIIVGKAEFGGGFICWKKEGKSDGCGAKFEANDQSILSQMIGKTVNLDVAEQENTILKMAQKRAMVGATLIATGCSDIFTQDMEPTEEAEWQPAPASSAPAVDQTTTAAPAAVRANGNGGSPDSAAGRRAARQEQLLARAMALCGNLGLVEMGPDSAVNIAATKSVLKSKGFTDLQKAVHHLEAQIAEREEAEKRNPAQPAVDPVATAEKAAAIIEQHVPAPAADTDRVLPDQLSEIRRLCALLEQDPAGHFMTELLERSYAPARTIEQLTATQARDLLSDLRDNTEGLEGEVPIEDAPAAVTSEPRPASLFPLK